MSNEHAHVPARALLTTADETTEAHDDGPIVLPRRAMPETDDVRRVNRKRRGFARPHRARR